ncbi:Co-chaperone Hsc20 [Anaeromyces robustus]|uniref:Co-chaperone Hsc20 n=1 Tax=Anaeromyces robustus TaxID=1754192 RepID=A0A1Y1XKY9_9FUNG|nr:Co-chaperone Hsc20 [Anaeromyces robustus]|eukprot:ORX86427.1 Co-chaperone Hsc20 [Anaeromyces robustus]
MSLIQKNCQSCLTTVKNALPSIKRISNPNISRNLSQFRTNNICSSPLTFNKKSLINSTSDNLKNLTYYNKQFKQQQQRLYATHSGKRCWKCKAENKIEAVFCENDKCKVIQILDPEVDYFNILGVEKSFDINLKDLKIKFLKLQQLVHPDNFSTKSDNEKKYSDIQSAYINKAYHTLINPLERSLYLLEINGHGVNENDNVKDMQFLMDIMSINEGIDDAEDQDDIDDISEENQERIKASIKIISDNYKLNNWDIVKDETIKLRYWTNIQNTLKEWTPKK